MDGWEEKLNTLLNDPDAMAQVVSLAQSLSAQTGGASSGTAAGTSSPGKGSVPGEGTTGGAGHSETNAGGIDPALLGKLLPLLRETGSAQSGAAALLYALRPYLRPSRRDKVERAVQLARVIHLAKTLMSAQEG